jgi:hypothetical protein
MLDHLDMRTTMHQSRTQLSITTVSNMSRDSRSIRQIASAENNSRIWLGWQKRQADGASRPVASSADVRHMLNRLLKP